jgi:hypothetical protein
MSRVVELHDDALEAHQFVIQLVTVSMWPDDKLRNPQFPDVSTPIGNRRLQALRSKAKSAMSHDNQTLELRDHVGYAHRSSKVFELAALSVLE